VQCWMYIGLGLVLRLAHMFYVMKGLDDIRMVYDGTSCGLNKVLWAPHFGLPIVNHIWRALLIGYFQGDMDVGEMFLNFPLHPTLQPYAGVDISHVMDKTDSAPEWEKGRVRKWESWRRNFMGLKDSPVRSIQLMIKAKQIAYGRQYTPGNPFGWKLVWLNLPGSRDYDP